MHDRSTAIGEREFMRGMIAVMRRVAAQDDVADVTRIVEEFLLDQLGERASLLIYDEDADMLWSAIDETREIPRGVGLLGDMIARPEPIVIERLDRAAASVPERDDPQGDARARLLAVPVLGDALLGVVVVARDRGRPAFAADEQAWLQTFADRLAPLLAALALAAELDDSLELAIAREPGPFRPEALAAAALAEHGAPLHVSTPLLRRATWSLVGLVALALAYLALAEVGHYAAGPALVRLAGRTEVSAHASGSVVAVLVEPGDSVVAGQTLVRFHDVEGAAEAARLEQEFELQLRALLREPDDAAVQREVASLRARKQEAATKREEHRVVAPQAGRVRDLRVRPGQALAPGDVVLSIDGDAAAPELVALLPGDERPRVAVGERMRFEITGYPDATIELEVAYVHDDVVGPSEALRLLGPVADGLTLDASVVLVGARLPSETFESRHARYRWHDGMRGRAEVRVKTTSMLEALIPALEELR
jgi:membrane fusion protein (multidrug efflux system)